MRISVIHPSRGRPRMFWNTQLRWVNRTKNKDFEYILSLDSTDIELAHYTVNALDGTTFCVNKNRSAIDAINNAAKIATGDLIVVISDDFDCPETWDMLLRSTCTGQSNFLIKTQDGIQPTLVTLPIMDRAYYETQGYIYHPDYLHMFCDQEMTAVAHMTGRVLTSPLVFSHNHYTVGGMAKDAINERNDATWPQGEQLFNERLANNFGLTSEQIIKPYSDIIWK